MVFAVVLMWAKVAVADAGPSKQAALVVYPNPSGPLSAQVVETELARRLADAHWVRVPLFEGARAAMDEGWIPESALKPFARARQVMAEGWQSYLEARPTFASARMSEARRVALEVTHLPGGPELLAEVSLRLGTIKVELGRGDEAADDFRLALALDPTLEVTEAHYKPEVVAAAQQALADQRGLQKRVFETAPASAVLHVDGRPSERDAQLSPGLHVVTLRAPGFVTDNRLIAVSPGGAQNISVELSVDAIETRILLGEEGLALGRPEFDARENLSALALYAGVERTYLVSSVWRRGEPALLGQRCEGQPVRCSAVVEIGFPKGSHRVAVDSLWRALASAALRFPPTLQVDARLVSAEGAPAKPPPPKASPWYTSRWLWVGVVGASLAATASAVLLSEDGRVLPVVGGERCDFGGC